MSMKGCRHGTAARLARQFGGGAQPVRDQLRECVLDLPPDAHPATACRVNGVLPDGIRPMVVRTSCLIALASALCACASTAASDESGATAYDAGAATDVVLTDVSARDAGERCDGVLPGTDSDGDGLDDVVEDANRNCVLDEGETDPHLADTDGDGLSDGDEDVDRNGVWDADRGELDPRNPDTDGDGVRDGDEVLAEVCTSALLDDVVRHRAASEGAVFFVDPALDARPALDGLGMLVVDTESPRAALLVSALEDPLRVSEVVGMIEAAAEALDADLWWESETAGQVRRLTLALETPYDVPLELVLAALGEVTEDGFGAEPPESSGASSRRYTLHIEAEARPGERIDGRLSVALSAEGDPVPWFREMGISAIAPDRESTLRAECEVLDATHVDTVDLVVAWPPSLALEVGLTDTVSAIGGLLADRANEDRLTRVWLVPGDGHVSETAGRPAHEAALGRVDQVFDGVFAVEPATDDQRVWLNALAFVESLPDRVESTGAIELIAVFDREDSEFRQGERDGRDGAPDAPPLAPGAARDARTGWYSERFAALGVDVTGVALRPGGEPECGRDLDGTGNGGLAPAMSARDVAIGAGGTFLEICAPDLEMAIERRLVESAGGAGRTPLERRPVGGVVEVYAGDDGERVTGYDVLDRGDGAWLVLPSRASTETLVTGYRFWDASLTD